MFPFYVSGFAIFFINNSYSLRVGKHRPWTNDTFCSISRAEFSDTLIQIQLSSNVKYPLCDKSGSCPAVDCTFPLSTFTETGLAEFISFTSTHIGSSVWNWKLWYLVKFFKGLKKLWWYVLGHKTPLAFSGPEQSVECCVHFYLTYELILAPAEIQKKFFSYNQIHYMMLLKGWQSVVK